MKVIIAGSRTFDDYGLVKKFIVEAGKRRKIFPRIVFCGGAIGVDELGARWAEENDIPVIMFPADWATHGKAAGPIRNSEMLKEADALIAIWDGVSRGTADMIRKAREKGIPVYLKLFHLGGANNA